MATFPWIKVVGVGFTAIQSVLAASKDGKVTIEEALKIMGEICGSIGVVFDGTGAEFVVRLIERLLVAAADKRITAAELIEIGEQICADLGVELDKTGVTIPG